MLLAPIPSNDSERLEELRSLGLLDTPSEERFDRFTRLLKLILRVPMAFISLVDAKRQWFKSAVGLEIIETPRSVSFCGHAILSDEPLIVPDATLDDRFRESPLVTSEPYIRFYAGQPLRGPAGHKVATICIADHRPRTLTAAEVEVLQVVGRLVERELGLTEAVHLQRQLIESRQQLMRELTQAAAYVRSLLPAPLTGPVSTRWRFEPSSQLGGDVLGYDWIDPDHFAIFLLDVSGHGVGAALLSVSVASALRSQSLPDTDFRDPAAVLARLNHAFPMDRNDEKYFTIWYGVFNRPSRRLVYASGGHPPALLLTGPNQDRARSVELPSENFPLGTSAGVPFTVSTAELEPFARLYVFSDGVYEIERPDGSMMTLAALASFLASSPSPDEVWGFTSRAAGFKPLADDFSLLEVLFEG